MVPDFAGLSHESQDYPALLHLKCTPPANTTPIPLGKGGSTHLKWGDVWALTDHQILERRGGLFHWPHTTADQTHSSALLNVELCCNKVVLGMCVGVSFTVNGTSVHQHTLLQCRSVNWPLNDYQCLGRGGSQSFTDVDNGEFFHPLTTVFFLMLISFHWPAGKTIWHIPDICTRVLVLHVLLLISACSYIVHDILLTAALYTLWFVLYSPDRWTL